PSLTTFRATSSPGSCAQQCSQTIGSTERRHKLRRCARSRLRHRNKTMSMGCDDLTRSLERRRRTGEEPFAESNEMEACRPRAMFVSSVHGATVALPNGQFVGRSTFSKLVPNRENVLPVILHADHDPALRHCLVVECLGKGADLSGAPAPVHRGANVEE